MRATRYFLPAVILAGIVIVGYRGLFQDPSVIESPLIGEPAPEFSLPSVEDPEVEVSSRGIADRFWLLNVWATWCIECRREHAFLVQLAQSGAIPIYGLDLRDERRLAVKWLTSLGDPYVDSAFDEDGRVAIDWGVYGAPETFLIGPDGRILFKHISPMRPEVWQREFVPIIVSAERAR